MRWASTAEIEPHVAAHPSQPADRRTTRSAPPSPAVSTPAAALGLDARRAAICHGCTANLGQPERPDSRRRFRGAPAPTESRPGELGRIAARQCWSPRRRSPRCSRAPFRASQTGGLTCYFNTTPDWVARSPGRCWSSRCAHDDVRIWGDAAMHVQRQRHRAFLPLRPAVANPSLAQYLTSPGWLQRVHRRTGRAYRSIGVFYSEGRVRSMS